MSHLCCCHGITFENDKTDFYLQLNWFVTNCRALHFLAIQFLVLWKIFWVTYLPTDITIAVLLCGVDQKVASGTKDKHKENEDDYSGILHSAYNSSLQRNRTTVFQRSHVLTGLQIEWFDATIKDKIPIVWSILKWESLTKADVSGSWTSWLLYKFWTTTPFPYMRLSNQTALCHKWKMQAPKFFSEFLLRTKSQIHAYLFLPSKALPELWFFQLWWQQSTN